MDNDKIRGVIFINENSWNLLKASISLLKTFKKIYKKNFINNLIYSLIMRIPKLKLISY